MKICKVCGAQLSDGAKFCVFCGNKAESTAQNGSKIVRLCADEDIAALICRTRSEEISVTQKPEAKKPPEKKSKSSKVWETVLQVLLVPVSLWTAFWLAGFIIVVMDAGSIDLTPGLLGGYIVFLLFIAVMPFFFSALFLYLLPSVSNKKWKKIIGIHGIIIALLTAFVTIALAAN